MPVPGSPRLAPKFKATAPTPGVWSPAQTPEAERKHFDLNFSDRQRETESESGKATRQEGEETPPVVWTPRSAPSPPAQRKAFRPVNFESPTLQRKVYSQRTTQESPPPTPPSSLPLSPLEQWGCQKTSSTHSLSVIEEVSTSSSTADTKLSTSLSAPITGLAPLAASSTDTSCRLPRAQNPTITLLQKAREGQLPRGAHYLDQNMSAYDAQKSRVQPNEIIYSVRRQYESESQEHKPKKMADLGPKKFEGIGPMTKEGIPIVLRSEVKDVNQQKWYKRMYDSLNKANKDNEFVTVRYKTKRKGQYPYSSAGGYLSEPEHLGAGYDSDATSTKYATLDRRRIRNKENDFTTSTMPRSSSVKAAVDVYKNQPGRIEDYEPGRSSIADKEVKQWWDEVMDIFDGQLESGQKSIPRPPPPQVSSGSKNKNYMNYALKDGYESDSTLVFKRRDENLQNQLMTPEEQKVAYKTIQKGGEVPMHGLRKPAPERPKEPAPVPHRSYAAPRDRHTMRQQESPHRYVESEVTIHYKSPVRSEAKEAWPEAELARRQAESMRRLYQEERRRKYLNELQDMYSRRHTDHFTPSQKSPIPLNRYDDFLDESPLPQKAYSPEPKLVARALYNFIGQTSRELSFRRGDIIFVRRQIDKNWFEGEHNAMIGLFPFNYVEIIPYDKIRTFPKKRSEGQARAKFSFLAQTHLELSLVKGELVLLTRRVDDNWFEGRIGNRKGIFPVSYVEVLVEPGERTVSPVQCVSPSTKPIASPASHSMMINGGRNDMSHHHYHPLPSGTYSSTSMTRQTKTTKQELAPVNQTLHIDTQSEPVPYRALYNYKPQNEDELELNEGDTVYVMEKCDDGWYVGSSQRSGCFGTFPGNYVERHIS